MIGAIAEPWPTKNTESKYEPARRRYDRISRQSNCGHRTGSRAVLANNANTPAPRAQAEVMVISARGVGRERWAALTS